MLAAMGTVLDEELGERQPSNAGHLAAVRELLR